MLDFIVSKTTLFYRAININRVGLVMRESVALTVERREMPLVFVDD